VSLRLAVEGESGSLAVEAVALRCGYDLAAAKVTVLGRCSAGQSRRGSIASRSGLEKTWARLLVDALDVGAVPVPTGASRRPRRHGGR